MPRWERRQGNTLADLRERRHREETRRNNSSVEEEIVNNGGTVNRETRRELERQGVEIERNTEDSIECNPSLNTISGVDWSRYFDFSINDCTLQSFRRIEEQEYKYIKSYNYTPKNFNFNTTGIESLDNLFMGVELEIDGGGENDIHAKYILDYLGEKNLYIMHDGSLTNGMEITTHPASLEYHKSLDYQGLFKELTNKGYKSHNTKTCGYHIHVNRNFFAENPTMQDLCITKVLYLLEKYWDNIKSLARRDSSYYSRRFNMNESESLFELLMKAKGISGEGKYQMVNLQHKDTMEFRLFKGTLKYETFIATLEFVRNLVYICKNKPLELIQQTSFEDIVLALHTDYLIDYLDSRGIRLQLEKIA